MAGLLFGSAGAHTYLKSGQVFYIQMVSKSQFLEPVKFTPLSQLKEPCRFASLISLKVN